jgi:hypothetical protein
VRLVSAGRAHGIAQEFYFVAAQIPLALKMLGLIVCLLQGSGQPIQPLGGLLAIALHCLLGFVVRV